MQFLITFLEGIITFVSPCVLPMIPLYVLYFAGGGEGKHKPLVNSLGFVAGFTAVFTLLGLFAGTLGGLLQRHEIAVNIISGAIIILFGLHYSGLVKIKLLDRTLKPDAKIKPDRFFPSLLFGVVFAVGWSPCTGAFLGSALLLAANQQSRITGMLLLLCYSLGLAIPFVLCAVLTDRLKNAFAFIKRNYRVINLICGIFLMIIGVLMATGIFTKLLRAVS